MTLMILLMMQENLQFHVAHVEHHASCEQLIQKTIVEESSTHVSHRIATSLCM